jgi:hypothetical protein
VATLEEKTTLIQSDALTELTFEGNINIGAVSTKVIIDGTNGNISANGSLGCGSINSSGNLNYWQYTKDNN